MTVRGVTVREATVRGSRRALVVLAPGPLTTVQDLGRRRHGHLGVGRSGAADRGALRLANRLLANPENAACLEVTLGGLEVRATGDLLVTLTGAPCPASVTCPDGRTRGIGHASVERLPDGATLRLGVPPRGLRTYLAVRGGIDAPEVLGSRATDLLSGLGPERPAPGSVLPVGPAPTEFPVADLAPAPEPESGVLMLDVLPGPRHDWFTPGALATLCAEPYEVTVQSDRVGMRLRGPRLERARDGELPSEGMVPGALQVPPSGQPTLFLADHPVTGGYPVIAVVRDHHVDRAAQARPGQRIRFRMAGDHRFTGS
ncbi:biotin-dependent carboxyltransferase family protein [Microbispora bryophytorum]|uniref:Biotin-dependent carboxyltransferase family protein n=1 Tax=Microbispora bryophytorum subsp. camponoti TaxID=1677852 RepID=A0ABR8KTH5_9ACTN|nr:biotin-dependent carboxyltransferase family protein [Microbispora camponoti]MBD3142040.1 biotin-dependent carboxyltransferase family protein [Microbispora camponoti]